MVKVVWAPAAIKDIDAIANYISKDSPQAAGNIVELFFEKIKLLEKFPLAGKPVPEIKMNSIREILVSRYR
jgi:toxin ParE1/3/4